MLRLRWFRFERPAKTVEQVVRNYNMLHGWTHDEYLLQSCRAHGDRVGKALFHSGLRRFLFNLGARA